MSAKTTRPEKGIFSGWWVVIGCMVSYSSMASINWMPTMIFPSLQQELGWTAADLGLLLASMQWLNILWAPIGGSVCDRIGNRWTILIFSIVAGSAVLMYTTVTQIWQMYLYYAVLCGFATQTVLMIAILSLPRKWFMKRSALASGLLGGFWGIISSIMFPLVCSLAVNIGWRRTIFIVTPTLTVITVLVTLLLIRDTPEKVGQNVDGVSDEELSRIRASMGSSVRRESAMTRSEAIRTPQFWLLGVIYGISMADLGAVQGNITLMAINYGISSGAAGTAMTALMVPAIFSRIGVGPLGDRFGKKRILGLSSAICAIFFFGGWLLVHDPISLYVFLVLIGLVLMAGMTLIPPLWGDLFGREHLSGIMGMGNAVTIFTAGLVTMSVGFLRTATGSYNPAFFFLGILFAVQIILLFILRPTEVAIASIGKKED
jgi:MFS family permease